MRDFGVPQRQQEKGEAIKIAVKKIVKGKLNEWIIMLKANGPAGHLGAVLKKIAIGRQEKYPP